MRYSGRDFILLFFFRADVSPISGRSGKSDTAAPAVRIGSKIKHNVRGKKRFVLTDRLSEIKKNFVL